MKINIKETIYNLIDKSKSKLQEWGIIKPRDCCNHCPAVETRPWIRTYTGKKFFIPVEDLTTICIEDIAHALSLECRFGGHTPVHYSVAQHSVLVSLNVPQEYALQGLLHDAQESFLRDIPAPFKKLMPDYKKLENDLCAKIFEKFGLNIPMHDSVHHIDKIMLYTEQRDFMKETPYWDITAPLLKDKIIPLSPVEAEKLFLDRFNQLYKESK